jgi:hypothetical protein
VVLSGIIANGQVLVTEHMANLQMAVKQTFLHSKENFALIIPGMI